MEEDKWIYSCLNPSCVVVFMYLYVTHGEDIPETPRCPLCKQGLNHCETVEATENVG